MALSQMDVPAAPAGSGGPAQVRPRRRVRTGIALLLIATGLGLLGWVGWQYLGTNYVSEQRQDDVTSQLERSWARGKDRAGTSWGSADAILRIPRFGDDYAMPILAGTSDEALASGVGHVEDTQGPGERGNYVLSAHRVTNGEPFADLPSLQVGDRVIVETRTKRFIYQLDTDGRSLVVPFTAGWVLERSPKNPDGGPQPPKSAGDRLLTLVTCSELFRTDNRSVVFGHLLSVEDKRS